MKKENVVVKRTSYYYLSLEGEGGTPCRVRGKENKAKLICPPSSALRASSPSRGKGTRGFTLIELLVVVLIIGILAAVALPQYQKAVLKSRVTEAKVLVKALVDAGDLWILQNPGKEYMPAMDELDIDVPTETTNWYFELDEHDGNGFSAYASNKLKDTYGAFYIGYASPKQTSDPFFTGKWWCSAHDEQGHKTCQQLGGTLADGFDSVYILP